MTVKATGYIAYQSNHVIFGTGETADHAREDAKRWCDHPNDLMIMPATQALLDDVMERGGDIQYSVTAKGVACLSAELNV